jgi:hypothetical protein
MSPKSHAVHRAWDILITMSATLAALVIPAGLVFSLQSQTAVASIAVIITLIFSLDI